MQRSQHDISLSPPVCIVVITLNKVSELLELKNQTVEAYLDKQAQVDVLGLGLGPVDLAILLVADVDTLEEDTTGMLIKPSRSQELNDKDYREEEIKLVKSYQTEKEVNLAVTSKNFEQNSLVILGQNWVQNTNPNIVAAIFEALSDHERDLTNRSRNKTPTSSRSRHKIQKKKIQMFSP